MASACVTAFEKVGLYSQTVAEICLQTLTAARKIEQKVIQVVAEDILILTVKDTVNAESFWNPKSRIFFQSLERIKSDGYARGGKHGNAKAVERACRCFHR